MKGNKNLFKIIISLICLILAMVVLFSVTYAYFTNNKDEEKTSNISATTVIPYAFSVISTDSINYSISADMMFSDNSSESMPIASDDANLIVSLVAGSDLKMTTCTYDVRWKWLEGDTYTQKSNADYPYEFSLSASKTISNAIAGVSYGNDNLSETDLSDFTLDTTDESDPFLVILKDQTISNNTLNPTAVTWNFKSNFYNLPSNQNDLGGKVYNSTIYVDNVKCTVES